MFGMVMDKRTKEMVRNEDIVQLTGRITETRMMTGINQRFVAPEARIANTCTAIGPAGEHLDFGFMD